MLVNENNKTNSKNGKLSVHFSFKIVIVKRSALNAGLQVQAVHFAFVLWLMVVIAIYAMLK